VGEYLNRAYQDRALLEVWNGTKWSIADTPDPGSQRDMLFGASALSKDNVWVVGDQESGNGIFETLAEHWDGHRWTAVPTPDPAPDGNHLYAVDAVSPNDVWAVGESLRGTDGGGQPLVEHWDGQRWTVAFGPAGGATDELLDGVTATSSGLWAVGESDSPAGGGQPLILQLAAGHVGQVAQLPALPDGADWSNLYGVAISGGSVWADGTYVDPATDNNNELVLHTVGGKWQLATAPEPGSGSNIPGGLASIDGQLWLAGMYDDGNQEMPLIEQR